MSWNDEREDLLKQLWADGLSCSQIAQRLGGVSRSAVIGKVHRLGLSGRSVVQRKPITQPARIREVRAAFLAGRPPIRVRPRRVATAPSNQLPLPFVPPVERKSLLDLGEHDCRWPCSDTSPHTFCGRPKQTGLPYCPSHARVAYQAPQPVRRTPITRPIEAPAEQPKSRVVEVA